ncbi:hypothetical protein GCM10028818_25640 [Spirosoma horti]
MNLLEIVTHQEKVGLDKPSKWTKLVEYEQTMLEESVAKVMRHLLSYFVWAGYGNN